MPGLFLCQLLSVIAMLKLKAFVRDISPPILVRWLQQAVHSKRLQEWEYVAPGWSYLTSHPEVRGWNVAEVLATYQQKWPNYVARVQGTEPLGVAHEAEATTGEDILSHNAIMTFGYVLALSARTKSKVSLLDWGGGIGHYYLLAKALLPNCEIDYHCKDVSLLAEHGAKLFPDQHFYSDDSCLQRRYDLVMASTSLHYTEQWQDLLHRLADATANYLYLANLPTIQHLRSFVFLQRAYQYGYNTEYLGWCLNRNEVIAQAQINGLKLVREFVYGHQPYIHGAPEQNEYRGYLFEHLGNNESEKH